MIETKPQIICSIDCKARFIGGKKYKPYPSADYDLTGYEEKDLKQDLFRVLIDQAAEYWHDRCAEYVGKFGDVGTCVGGAGIAINYRKPKCRTYKRRIILHPPSSATQGASTWEASVKDVVGWLKAHGVDCFYHCGYMD